MDENIIKYAEKYIYLILRSLVKGLIQTEYWLHNYRKGNNSICSNFYFEPALIQQEMFA